MDLYLLSFNNYYNRQVKKFDTFAEYEPYILDVIENYNFVPGDGVNTVLKTINYSGETQPDYALVVDGTEIKSRWFVIDIDFIRNGQYRFILHRDVIVDNYDEVIKAPVFIEKATVDNEDPLIFNSEDMTFNQIKTDEVLLEDESSCPWIVGYVSTKNGKGEQNRINGTIERSDNPADIIVNGPLSSWKFAKYIDQPTRLLTDTLIYFPAFLDVNGSTRGDRVGFKINLNGTLAEGVDVFHSEQKDRFSFFMPKNLDKNIVFNKLKASKNTLRGPFFDFATSIISNLLYGDSANELRSLNGKTIKYLENGREVKKRIVFSNFVKTAKDGNLNTAATEPGKTYTKVFNAAGVPGTLGENGFLEYDFHYEQFSFSLQDAGKATYTFDTGVNGIRGLEDAPYSMFCMPYGEITIKNVNFEGSPVNIKTSKYLNLNLATGIAEIGGETVYDLQLVPYCPIQEFIESEGVLNLSGAKVEQDYNFVTDNTGSSKALVGIVLYPHRSTFSFNINLLHPIEITEPKIQSQCDMYRLCSPNFNGTFEFNAAKNGGVKYFNVDVTYLPFNPYIHVNPNFNNLYGKDFDDPRGLICGGDFSLARVNDAWTNYQLNNKNYKQMFDRNIQNMNVVNKYQKISDQINAVVGTVQGAVSGGIMGNIGMGASKTGIASGVAGAAIGGIASGIAGAADVYINDKLRNEAMDLAKDQFGYQLGNIQAIPDSLAKTTAYTLNNKYFPVLEYYTCKEREKQALRDKIKYNGMTVMVIGNIREYLQPEPSYIKGKLIRLEGLSEDFHMVNSIAAELNQGIFI